MEAATEEAATVEVLVGMVEGGDNIVANGSAGAAAEKAPTMEADVASAGRLHVPADAMVAVVPAVLAGRETRVANAATRGARS